MNDFEEISSQQVDQFVDGELSERERREVLLAADREPEIWRRLALAFVEAQTLRRELPSFIAPVETLPSSVARPVKSGTLTALRLAGLVACCLFAFGLGRWSNSADARMAAHSTETATQPGTFATQVLNAPSVAARESDGPKEHQTMRLVLDDLLGGPPQAVDVPLVDQSQDDLRELLSGPPVIPPEIQRALLRAGRRVHEERQLFEVELSDGRRGVVPVSNVLVENAGLNVYQ